jgi:DNA polymerase-3 subunit chi
MTRIDFYILKETTVEDRQAFACRLVQKTRQLGHNIYIHCDDENSAITLDKLLWSFQETSFLPHKLNNAKGADCPIVIGFNDTADAPGEHHDLLINMSLNIPSFFSRFERMAEIVVQEESILEATRNNYRVYNQKNYPLHRHDLR